MFVILGYFLLTEYSFCRECFTVALARSVIFWGGLETLNRLDNQCEEKTNWQCQREFFKRGWRKWTCRSFIVAKTIYHVCCDFLVACRFVSILFAITSFFTLWICVKVLIHEKREWKHSYHGTVTSWERKKLGTGIAGPPKALQGIKCSSSSKF